MCFTAKNLFNKKIKTYNIKHIIIIIVLFYVNHKKKELPFPPPYFYISFNICIVCQKMYSLVIHPPLPLLLFTSLKTKQRKQHHYLTFPFPPVLLLEISRVMFVFLSLLPPLFLPPIKSNQVSFSFFKKQNKTTESHSFCFQRFPLSSFAFLVAFSLP
eukprot:UN01047